MNDFEEQLVTCFAAVFPDRSRDEIVTATRAAFPEWDSLAAITLLSLIQQEFATDIDLFDLENLASFPLLLDHLRRTTAPETGRSAMHG